VIPVVEFVLLLVGIPVGLLIGALLDRFGIAERERRWQP
jgi:hypothetical protein